MNYAEFIIFSRSRVIEARKDLSEVVKRLELTEDQALEIRAIIGKLMSDYGLTETETGYLISRIILVIGQENLLKKAEELI